MSVPDDSGAIAEELRFEAGGKLTPGAIEVVCEHPSRIRSPDFYRTQGRHQTNRSRCSTPKRGWSLAL